MSLPSQAEANESFFERSRAEWDAQGGHPALKNIGNRPEPVRTADSLRPTIPLEGGQLHTIAATAENLLADEVYVRGQQLVRIGKAPELQAPELQNICRDGEQAVLVPVSAEYIRRRLTELAIFTKYREREKKYIALDCPKDVAANIVGAGDWPKFSPLDGIATSPFLRANLSICATPGYDSQARVFYAPTTCFAAVPDKPTQAQAREALQALHEPFAEFPFAGEAARAAFLSHLLTAVARHAIGTTPVFFYTAPLPGTGKTLLANAPSVIASGVVPAARPYADDSDELRKVLYAALLAADNFLLFDNLTNGSKVRSPVLCAFATAPVYGDRRLGVSEIRPLPNRCTVALTGNNLTPAGDLARRSIVIRLDANAETARGRDFTIPDLRQYIAQHRPKLLVSALTVIRAYAIAGMPAASRPLESFESWSRIARDPLLWLGLPDPLETQEAEVDDELGPLRAAFAAMALWPKLREPFGARDVAQSCDGFGCEATALREAVDAAGCSNSTDPLKVGYWLRAHRDRVAGSLKLKQASMQHGIARWKLEPMR